MKFQIFCKINKLFIAAVKHNNTGLFISPSGISDPCGTVAGMVTPKGSMSIVGERHSKILSYLTGARYVDF